MKKYLILISLILFVGCNNKKVDELFYSSINDLKSSQYQKALQGFITVTRNYPNHRLVDDSFYWIGNTYQYYLYQPKRSLNYYMTIIKNFPNSEFYIQSNFRVAKIYEQEDVNIENSIYIYQNILNHKNSTNEEKIVAYENIAKNYIKLNQYQNARFILKKMYQEYKIYEEVLSIIYNLISLSYHREGKLNLAAASYREALLKIKDNDLKEEIYYKLAEIYENQGNLVDSVKLYQKIVDNSQSGNQHYKLKLDMVESRLKKTKK